MPLIAVAVAAVFGRPVSIETIKRRGQNCSIVGVINWVAITGKLTPFRGLWPRKGCANRVVTAHKELRVVQRLLKTFIVRIGE